MPELDCYSPRIETMSAKETRQIQEAKLLKQIRYVYDRSPFYREKFDRAGVEPRDIRGLADLPRIPFTTKEELRDRLVVAVVNFPPKQIATHVSEVLVLAGVNPDGSMRLLQPDADVALGARVR